MSDPSISFIQDGRGVVLHHTPYESEGVSQELLANHPEILAGGNDRR